MTNEREAAASDARLGRAYHAELRLVAWEHNDCCPSVDEDVEGMIDVMSIEDLEFRLSELGYDLVPIMNAAKVEE